MKHLFKFNESKAEELPKLPEEVYTYLRSLNTGDYECYIQEGFFKMRYNKNFCFQSEESVDRGYKDESSEFFSNPAINFIINKKSIKDDKDFRADEFEYFDDIYLVEKFLSFVMNIIEELENMNMIVNYTILLPYQFRLMIRGKR
jgi:hypothetical protein